MGTFIYLVIDGVLRLVVMAIIISAILSWLIMFDVINMRHRFVYGVVRFLDAVTAPILWPFRKVIPTLGGVDISPLIAIIVIEAARRSLLPWLFAPIRAVIG